MGWLNTEQSGGESHDNTGGWSEGFQNFKSWDLFVTVEKEVGRYIPHSGDKWDHFVGRLTSQLMADTKSTLRPIINLVAEAREWVG